ncbi:MULTISPECIES: DegV family protein [unclassified Fusibacter]|uniref:DegV family protein n=1 Tax=unclassified Fusibacter TaxID=2624464 RepID=UPI0010128F64|nr:MULTISPECIES: DegV family protein [unclassified Fusibacter]MCK8059753.1 DegV family protein [Fusibacter sp. A2]NPE21554.1 DegV family protein [Fusibacter sp. A1]RXV61962.1 DegV family protein [Fusibacter sp. A1]
MAIRIVTDSVADVPAALVEKHKITVMPLTVNFSDESYRDGIDISKKEFFEKLATCQKLPTTSQVTPGLFLEAFNEILDQGDELIGIFMSSKLSGTYQAAVSAKEMIGSDKIHVIDSGLVAFAIGQIAVALSILAENGADMDYLLETADQMIEKTSCRFIVDTLEFLTKGGRLKPAEALVGNLLNIKPILTMIDGELKSAGKARGRKKAMKSVMDWLDTSNFDLNNKMVSLYHAVDEQYKEEVKKALLDKYPQMLLTESEVGCVVGTHSGPGCVAMSFIDINLNELKFWR